MAVVERPTRRTRDEIASRAATGTLSFPNHTRTGPPHDARTAVVSENILRAFTAPFRGPVYTNWNPPADVSLLGPPVVE